MQHRLPDSATLEAALAEIDREIRASGDWGSVATYIPELASVPPDRFGASICLADGREAQVGEADVPFSIQSVSKVFTLAMALGRYGDQLWRRVGKEPSGKAFNSIVQLEQEGGIPRNPFVNAGAIVTTDMVLAGASPRERLGELLRFLRAAAGDGAIHINEATARSEDATGNRNYALAYFLRSCGNLTHRPELTLGTYFHHCAIEMTCTQLARAGRILCGAFRAQQVIPEPRVRSINALMMTCGHYDGSGNFAYRVGFPGKSGVGGGILAVVPGTASIAVWAPGLDDYGNSKQGTLALERISRRFGWSLFG